MPFMGHRKEPDSSGTADVQGGNGRRLVASGGGHRPFYMSTTTLAATQSPTSMVLVYGALSPLSSWGPMGLLGPIGTNVWNPSLLMKLVGLIPGMQEFVDQWSLVLSASGPLGPAGPMQALTAFPALAGGGPWTGVGALGALSPLGTPRSAWPNRPEGLSGGTPTVRSSDPVVR